tara:strand:+ start:389 stop:544 length:156 start_codon:yes stop_codon:yes gene_type:complete
MSERTYTEDEMLAVEGKLEDTEGKLEEALSDLALIKEELENLEYRIDCKCL